MNNLEANVWDEFESSGVKVSVFIIFSSFQSIFTRQFHKTAKQNS